MREITSQMIRAALPPIGADFSKFDRGRLFLIAGSYGMAGAAVLSGRAALRSGVGYLDMAVPESIYPIVTAAVPEAVCSVYREDDPEDLRTKIREGVKKADAVAAGPGLGKNRSLVMPVLFGLSGKKLLLDADGLNYLAEAHADARSRACTGDAEKENTDPEIRFSELALTPHTGEMGRLLRMSRSEVEKGRFQAVTECAREFHACALLKGRNTLISDSEGNVCMNPSGNAGLARAGSGDTLTGITGALMAQGMSAFDALCAGAFIHGTAGDLCLQAYGLRSFLPEDLIEMLPQVFLNLES